MMDKQTRAFRNTEIKLLNLFLMLSRKNKTSFEFEATRFFGSLLGKKSNHQYESSRSHFASDDGYHNKSLSNWLRALVDDEFGRRLPSMQLLSSKPTNLNSGDYINIRMRVASHTEANKFLLRKMSKYNFFGVRVIDTEFDIRVPIIDKPMSLIKKPKKLSHELFRMHSDDVVKCVYDNKTDGFMASMIELTSTRNSIIDKEIKLRKKDRDVILSDLAAIDKVIDTLNKSKIIFA